MDELVSLRYQAAPSERFNGDILVTDIGPDQEARIDAETQRVMSFMGLTFAQMLRELAAELRDRDRAAVLFQRLDLPGLRGVLLPPDIVHLLRTDVPEAVRALSFSVKSSSKEAPKQVVTPVLKAGVDTLVDSFGETVFVRIRDGHIECPGCGRWSQFATPFVCQKTCEIQVQGERSDTDWFEVRVEDLLQTGGHKGNFYIPRAWAPASGRISLSELNQELTSWRLQKETIS